MDERIQSQTVVNSLVLFIQLSSKDKILAIENRPQVASYEWRKVCLLSGAGSGGELTVS